MEISLDDTLRGGQDSGASVWRRLTNNSAATVLFPVIRVDVLGDPDAPSNTFEFSGAPEIVVNDWYPVDTPHPNNGDVINPLTLASGNIRLYGSVLAPVTITGPGVSLRVDEDVLAPITWTGAPLNQLRIEGSAIADITLGPDCCNAGSVFVQHLQSTLIVSSDLVLPATIGIGTLSGEVLIDGDVNSQIDLGSLAGLLSISGSVSATSAIYADSLSGQLRVAGDHFGYIYCLTPLSGRVLIDGGCSRSSGLSIAVFDLAPSGAISIDNDGWNVGDDWAPQSPVRVDTTDYFSNGERFGIWEITCCRGDLNNDEIVNNFDIDPFVMALVDPAAYDAEFPGLVDSMSYHADANADGLVNNFDIGPFVERVNDLCCSELYPCVAGSCGPLAARSAPQAPLTPGETAEILSSGVSIGWRPQLEHAIGEMAASSNHDERTYWASVLLEMDRRR